jgi:molybdopterin synthase catalytic subunit
MTLDDLLEKAKQHPGIDGAGMILCHNGIVRGTSRDGRPVKGLRVTVDAQKLKQVVSEQKKRPGIIEILVEIFADRDLMVGDDVMYLVVAGDIRENVITVLQDTLNAIKITVTSKTEYFI